MLSYPSIAIFLFKFGNLKFSFVIFVSYIVHECTLLLISLKLKKTRRVKQTRLTHTDNNTDQTHKKIKKEVKCELLI